MKIEEEIEDYAWCQKLWSRMVSSRQEHIVGPCHLEIEQGTQRCFMPPCMRWRDAPTAAPPQHSSSSPAWTWVACTLVFLCAELAARELFRCSQLAWAWVIGIANVLAGVSLPVPQLPQQHMQLRHVWRGLSCGPRVLNSSSNPWRPPNAGAAARLSREKKRVTAIATLGAAQFYLCCWHGKHRVF